MQFALAFDIEEIRAKAKAIDDPRERVLFLNTKLTDYRIFEGLNRDEEAWVDEIVGSARRTLLEKAEKELKLSSGRQKQPEKDAKQGNQSKSKLQEEHIHPVTRRPVLYDLGIAALPQFASMRMEFHGGVLTTPWANERAFESVVRTMFSDAGNRETLYLIINQRINILTFSLLSPTVPEFFEGPIFLLQKKPSGDKKSEECPRYYKAGFCSVQPN